jgi:hypothetical protein
MRRLLAAVSVLMVGAFAAMSGAASAYAAPALPSDLQVVASQVSGHIGGTAEVRLVVRNNGPNPVMPETWELTITAPPGTRIAGGSALAGNCIQNDGGAQCRYGFGLRRGERHELKLGLQIQAQPSGCGRAAISYAMDPRERNNAVNLRVAVDGVPRSCSGAQSSPQPTKSPTASQTPEAEITDAPPQDAPASAEAVPAAPGSDSNGGGMSVAGILVIGGGLLLVALGGLLIWRLLRREPEDGYGEDAQPAATTAWNSRTAQWDAAPTQQWDAGPTQQWNAGPTQQWDARPTQQWDAGPTQQWNAGPSEQSGGRHTRRPGEYPPGDDTGPIYGR